MAPGEYHFHRAPEGPAYTIAGRLAPATDANAVGPGEYEPQPDGPTGPAYTMRRKHCSHVRIYSCFLTCAESAAMTTSLLQKCQLHRCASYAFEREPAPLHSRNPARKAAS